MGDTVCLGRVSAPDGESRLELGELSLVVCDAISIVINSKAVMNDTFRYALFSGGRKKAGKNL